MFCITLQQTGPSPPRAYHRCPDNEIRLQLPPSSRSSLTYLSCTDAPCSEREASWTGFLSTNQQEQWFTIQTGSRCKISFKKKSFFFLSKHHYLSTASPITAFRLGACGPRVLVWLRAVTGERLWDTDNVAYFGECASIPDLHGSDHDSESRGEEDDWKSHQFTSLQWITLQPLCHHAPTSASYFLCFLYLLTGPVEKNFSLMSFC